MKRKNVSEWDEAKATEMLLMAWGFADWDEETAAMIARKASENGST